MARPMPWESQPHLPWKAFADPTAQWDALPSFMVGELLFISLALLALWHAWRKGPDHLIVWFGALLAGTANDFIFMALPLVDNFWQAQGSLMLTPRMPLYIPCVYVCFMYVPTVTARRWGMTPIATAALTGLLASLFYAPYDIVGAKFLWWTWHDTDKPIAARLFGAPCSSSLWVMTFSASFAWLLAKTLPIRAESTAAIDGGSASRVVPATIAKALGAVTAFSTALMMVQMTALQQLDGGTPGYIALGTTAVLYGVAGWRGRSTAQSGSAERGPWIHADQVLTRAIVVYFIVLAAIMAVFDPASHVSTGVHQPPGKCYVEAKDITGLTRHEFLCVTDFAEDYTFDCTTPPASAAEWYTICGKPHGNFAGWLGAVGGLGLLGTVAFGRLRRAP